MDMLIQLILVTALMPVGRLIAETVYKDKFYDYEWSVPPELFEFMSYWPGLCVEEGCPNYKENPNTTEGCDKMDEMMSCMYNSYVEGRSDFMRVWFRKLWKKCMKGKVKGYPKMIGVADFGGLNYSDAMQENVDCGWKQAMKNFQQEENPQADYFVEAFFKGQSICEASMKMEVHILGDKDDKINECVKSIMWKFEKGLKPTQVMEKLKIPESNENYTNFLYMSKSIKFINDAQDKQDILAFIFDHLQAGYDEVWQSWYDQSDYYYAPSYNYNNPGSGYLNNNAYPPGYNPQKVAAKDETNPDQTNPSQSNPSQSNPSQSNPDQSNPDQSGPSVTTGGSKRGLDPRKPRALKSAARLMPSDHNKIKRQARKQQLAKRRPKQQLTKRQLKQKVGTDHNKIKRQARKQQLAKRQTKSPRGKKIQKNKKKNNNNDYKGMGDYGDDDDDYDYDYDYGSSHSDESDVKVLTPHEYVMFKKRAIESAFQKKTQQTTGPSTPGAPIGQPPNQNQRKGSLNSSAMLTPNEVNILFAMLVALLALWSRTNA